MGILAFNYKKKKKTLFKPPSLVYHETFWSSFKSTFCTYAIDVL